MKKLIASCILSLVFLGASAKASPLEFFVEGKVVKITDSKIKLVISRGQSIVVPSGMIVDEVPRLGRVARARLTLEDLSLAIAEAR